MRTHLLYAVIFGFLAGVFARSSFLLGFAVAGFAVLLAVTAVLFTFADKTKRKPLIILAVALVAFSGGILRMQSAVLIGDPELTARLDKQITVSGVVSAEPDVRETGTRISVRVDELTVSSSTIPIKAGILALAEPHTNISYGDRVKATGTLRLPEAFDVSNGRQFNYPEYLAKDGIGYQLAFAQIEKMGKNEGNILKSSAIWAKRNFLKGLERALPEPSAGLGGGITVGAKRGLGKELNDMFITVGLVHVLVLSGYNITIVINAVGFALSRFSRLFYISGAVFVAIFFALMTGGASSSVRAALMAVIAVLGRTTGRLYFASRVLGIVALGMVLWNPFILAFDLGFQLSVLATLGLIWFTPIFSARLPWMTEKFALREITATTLGTQLAVLPLLLYQNGQLPLFSLPANLLALIAVPPAMFFSAVASVGGFLAGPLAPAVALPAHILLTYIIEVAKIFAGLPFSSLAIGAFSAWWMFLAYAVMFGWLVFMKKRRGSQASPSVPKPFSG